MNKNLVIGAVILLLIVSGYFFFTAPAGQRLLETTSTPSPTAVPSNSLSNLQNAYVFNPQQTDARIQLKDGKADLKDPQGNYAGFANLGTKAASVGNAIVTTTNFNYGGSGVFVYVTPYEAMQTGWQMSDVQLLGDRVKVESVTSDGDIVTVVYYDFGPSQSMADDPNVRIEAKYTYSEGKLTAIK